MTRLLFYCIIMPLAYLPLPVLHALANLSAIFLYRVAHYRRKVVAQNLLHSFPDMDERERVRLSKRFYIHLADLFAEALHNLRAKPSQILDHYHVVNPELLRPYFERGQSVMLLSAHYNNWEYMVSSLDTQFLHHGVGVGKPLSNKKFERMLNEKRTRYGTEVVDQTNVREVMAYYDRHHVPVAYMMLGDQSPSNPHKSYWTTFLNQETPFLFGTEHLAVKYNYPVIYYAVSKPRRGYYEVKLQTLTDHPQQEQPGSITQKYAQLLEEQIKAAPQYWLWSHRRWKRQRPTDMPMNTVSNHEPPKQ